MILIANKTELNIGVSSSNIRMTIISSNITGLVNGTDSTMDITLITLGNVSYKLAGGSLDLRAVGFELLKGQRITAEKGFFYPLGYITSILRLEIAR